MTEAGDGHARGPVVWKGSQDFHSNHTSSRARSFRASGLTWRGGHRQRSQSRAHGSCRQTAAKHRRLLCHGLYRHAGHAPPLLPGPARSSPVQPGPGLSDSTPT